MTIQRNGFRWRAIGASVRGDSHARDGRPNQDAISWSPGSGKGPPLVLLVADGHGSEKSFRSGTGARIAVETAKRILLAFANSQQSSANLSAVKHMAEERLPQVLARTWYKAAAAHLKQKPFLATELEELENKKGSLAQQAILKRPHSAYGTTLLAVLVTENYILFLQLGDGDIVTVSEAGEASRPLPPDPASFGNETNSLAGENSWQDMRVCFQAHNGAPPALIVMSSDGFGYSYRDDEAFFAVGPDILQQIRSDGLDSVRERLPEWLETATRQGSGDDITVGIIKRIEETDIDAVLQRLSVCEAGLDALMEEAQRLSALEEASECNRQALAGLREQVKQARENQRETSRLLMGILIVVFAVSVGLAALALRRGPVILPGGWPEPAMPGLVKTGDL
jgi:serine/threonine protein phosphatase PrpC